mmetsp:Transcript_3236/g.7106  ORF Transcript_3236/g.7106 Transcript_3236/m.7106 type:complete len:224 (+) Transcript_3236:1338-2009(+)
MQLRADRDGAGLWGDVWQHMPRSRSRPQPQQQPQQAGLHAGAGRAQDAGHCHPGGITQTGDGGGARELQGRDGGGGHVPRCGRQQAVCEAEAHSGDQGVVAECVAKHVAECVAELVAECVMPVASVGAVPQWARATLGPPPPRRREERRNTQRASLQKCNEALSSNCGSGATSGMSSGVGMGAPGSNRECVHAALQNIRTLWPALLLGHAAFGVRIAGVLDEM